MAIWYGKLRRTIMKPTTAVIFTVCFVSLALNIGLVTKYVQIGHTDMCIPSMSMDALK